MPGLKPHVTFSSPIFSRLPRDDEEYVMKAFARHAAHCLSCARPYDVFRQGGTLCPTGHELAIDVAQYVYSQAGQAYSQVDREGHQRIQIEIPAKCEAVRGLLKAMERGLRLRKKTSVASYDRTYLVTARPPPIIHQREPSYVRKPKLETTPPPAWAIPNSRRTRAVQHVGKGSLYAQEVEERQQYYKPPVYYRIAPAGPPVPPKDGYWG